MGTLLTYHLRESQRSARRSVEHQRGFPWRTPKLALAGGAATRDHSSFSDKCVHGGTAELTPPRGENVQSGAGRTLQIGQLRVAGNVPGTTGQVPASADNLPAYCSRQWLILSNYARLIEYDMARGLSNPRRSRMERGRHLT